LTSDRSDYLRRADSPSRIEQATAARTEREEDAAALDALLAKAAKA
jgi:hypothetical protein